MSSLLVNKKLFDINEKDEDEYRSNVHKLKAARSLKNIFLFKLNYNSDENLHKHHQHSSHHQINNIFEQQKQSKKNQRVNYSRSSREPNQIRQHCDLDDWDDNKKFNSKSTNTDFISNIRILNTHTAHPTGRPGLLHQKSSDSFEYKTNMRNVNLLQNGPIKSESFLNSVEKWSSQVNEQQLHQQSQHRQQQRANSAILPSKKIKSASKHRSFNFHLNEIKFIPNPFRPPSVHMIDRESRNCSVMYERPGDALRNSLETPHQYTQINEELNHSAGYCKSNSDYHQTPSHDDTTAASPDVYTRVGKTSNINVYSNLEAKTNSTKPTKKDLKKTRKRNNLILVTQKSTDATPITQQQQLQKSPSYNYNQILTKNPPATDMKPPNMDDIHSEAKSTSNSSQATKKTDFFKYINKQKSTLKAFLTSQLQSKFSNSTNKKGAKPEICSPLKRTPSKIDMNNKSLTDFNDEKIRHFTNCIITELKIGEGEFGETFQGFRYDLGTDPVKIAAKRLKLVNYKTNRKDDDVKVNSYNSDVLAEVRVLSQLGKHDNVIEFLGIRMVNETMYMLFEYAEKGDLKKLLDNSRTNSHCELNLNLLWKLKFAYEIACGMEYIASIGIVHKDLAARNVLLTNEYSCKIADFSCLKSDFMTKCPVRWMAPECITKGMFTTESDVWSFGVVMWEIWTIGIIPYPGMNDDEVVHKVNQWYRLYKPQECPDDVYNIMKSCWKEYHKARPRFKQLMHVIRTIYQSALEISDSPGK